MTEGEGRKRLETDLPASMAASKLAIQERTGNGYADLRIADAK